LEDFIIISLLVDEPFIASYPERVEYNNDLVFPFAKESFIVLEEGEVNSDKESLDSLSLCDSIDNGDTLPCFIPNENMFISGFILLGE
jgi:hypothetical protein